jgi:hypothetical protein
MELKKHSDRVSCPTKLDPDMMVINFNAAQSYPSFENFEEPWSLNGLTESIQISTTLHKLVNFKYQAKTVTTTARKMLFEVVAKVESRLVYHSASYDYKTVKPNANLLDDVLLLTVSFTSPNAQQQITRTYRTLIDTLSDIGGFSDILVMAIGIVYGFYLDSHLEKDLIHKA